MLAIGWRTLGPPQALTSPAPGTSNAIPLVVIGCSDGCRFDRNAWSSGTNAWVRRRAVGRQLTIGATRAALMFATPRV